VNSFLQSGGVLEQKYNPFKEGRMSGHINTQILEALQRTRLFSGLSIQECESFLHIWKQATYEVGETVYTEGEESTDMLLVLSGAVELSAQETRIGVITPVDLVGEMGTFTDMPRSATVTATSGKPLVALRVGKDALDAFLSEDSALTAKIQRNIIEILCEKIREDNRRLHEATQS